MIFIVYCIFTTGSILYRLLRSENWFKKIITKDRKYVKLPEDPHGLVLSTALPTSSHSLTISCNWSWKVTRIQQNLNWGIYLQESRCWQKMPPVGRRALKGSGNLCFDIVLHVQSAHAFWWGNQFLVDLKIKLKLKQKKATTYLEGARNTLTLINRGHYAQRGNGFHLNVIT